jgi:eukaryotic-like serine/threonine-protein kinase
MKFWEVEQQRIRWMLVESALENKGRVIAQTQGTFGDIYILDMGEHCSPRYGIAKIPRINSGDSEEQIKLKITKFLHEINETYKYSRHEIIARHADLKICFGVPVVYSRKRDMTLKDIVDQGPLETVEAVSITVQLAHGLAYCASKGLSSHQDMKPDNVLAEAVRDYFGVPDDYPLKYRVFICDFGMANAFSVFGKPFGSRPYMAPEQYVNPSTLAKADVFALGVILHELLSGFHPIGEVTCDVWPIPLPEKGNKWKRENVWKAWSCSEKKVNCSLQIDSGLAYIIERALHPNLAKRPSIASLEAELLKLLYERNELAALSLILLLQTYDKYAASAEVSGWPYYEHLLEELNQADFG